MAYIAILKLIVELKYGIQRSSIFLNKPFSKSLRETLPVVS